MITLPFPPASLSGHVKGHWRDTSPVVARHREWARYATLEVNPAVPNDGDIPVTVTFVPPNNRGDRINFPNRMKPYFDGIADALGVNDKRFLPRFAFMPAEKPGRVEVTIGEVIAPEHDELNGFARQLALDAIKYARSDENLKQRILKAREWGLLDDEETEDWIAMAGVKHA